MLISVWKKIPKQTVWVFLALGAGLLLLLPKRGGEAAAPKTQEFAFSLEAEEKRMEAALSRIEGAGEVTVVLSLEASEEREYARNLDSDRQSEADSARSSCFWSASSLVRTRKVPTTEQTTPMAAMTIGARMAFIWMASPSEKKAEAPRAIVARMEPA